METVIVLLVCVLVGSAGATCGSTPQNPKFKSAFGISLGQASAQPAPTINHVDEMDTFSVDLATLPSPVLKNHLRRGDIPQPEGAVLTVPNGFTVNIFSPNDTDSQMYNTPRQMVMAPNGDIFLSDTEAGIIYVLRDVTGDGVADIKNVFVRGLKTPYGLGVQNGFVYVATADSVIRYQYQDGQTVASDQGEVIVNIPVDAFSEENTHDLEFTKDGSKFYLGVGGSGFAIPDKKSFAGTVRLFNADGSNGKVIASGISNPVGLAIWPATGKVWMAVQGVDGLGDELPPDYVAEVKEGKFYGWPYTYAGLIEDPRTPNLPRNLQAITVVPELLLKAHSGPAGIVFNNGQIFPKQYEGDLFVALNDYYYGAKVVRVNMVNGKLASNQYDNFLSGFSTEDGDSPAWGRPAAVVFAKDGALLVSDDAGKKIWRVSYTGNQ